MPKLVTTSVAMTGCLALWVVLGQAESGERGKELFERRCSGCHALDKDKEVNGKEASSELFRLLAGRLGDQGLDNSIQHPGCDTAPTGNPIPVPAIAMSAKDPAGWVEPDTGKPLAFRTMGQSAQTELEPLYKVSGQRYAVYWKTTTS